MLIGLLMPVMALAQIRIWEGTEVRARGVTLTAYLPAKADSTTTAVIVCPGGSYHWLAMRTEGEEVAEWLRANGIAAFVLRYRTAGFFAFATHYRLLCRGTRHPDMICDLQRAIQLVRENAGEWPINPQRVGVMGFSAGGHLALSAAMFSTTDFMASCGIKVVEPLRPDFVAALYPVVTMTDLDCVHRRSRRGMLGECAGRKSRSQLRDSLSVERHVGAEWPPVFLVNCADDRVVNPQNARLMDSALTVQGIPHTYIHYRTGGHGFGVREDEQTAECKAWKIELLNWLKDRDF